MSEFEEILALDAPLYAQMTEHESVQIRPKGGEWRTVYPVIDRNPPESFGADGSVRRIAATFQFNNHATNGLLVTEVQGCEVRYNVRKGDSASRKDALLKLASDTNPVDAGCVRCEV